MTASRIGGVPAPASPDEPRPREEHSSALGNDDRVVEVVAGVLQDARGRVLLARRTHGRDLAGLWEFPGGKREPGETPEAALIRELHEELGVDVEIGAPLINVPYRYPHKRLRLDVRRIASWRGTPRGHEGQALAWAPLHTLPNYSMPLADRPVVAALLQPDRYLVTPAPAEDSSSWLASLQMALDGGIQRIQLRSLPSHDAHAFRTVARTAVDRCRVAGVDVLVNGDIALARELGIGVHLRNAQLLELKTRPLPDGFAVSASCHDATGLVQAEQLGCDFVVLGPIASTPTHPGAAGIGWTTLAALRECVSLPIYAIGGMTPNDITTARAHGSQGIAAIRSLWPVPSRQRS